MAVVGGPQVAGLEGADEAPQKLQGPGGLGRNLRSHGQTRTETRLQPGHSRPIHTGRFTCWAQRREAQGLLLVAPGKCSWPLREAPCLGVRDPRPGRPVSVPPPSPLRVRPPRTSAQSICMDSGWAPCPDSPHQGGLSHLGINGVRSRRTDADFSKHFSCFKSQ